MTARIGEDVCNEPATEMKNITSLAVGTTEDVLYFMTENNQLMKVNIALDGTECEETNFEYVHEPFHEQAITGMDVCLRKQLVVTCSNKYIKIWNYATKQLEIQMRCQVGDETLAIAFHPSGFHLVVAYNDKVCIMDVLSNSIKERASY